MTSGQNSGNIQTLAADAMTASAKVLAAGAVERQIARQPGVAREYAPLGFTDLAGDTEMRISYLAAALSVQRAQLFFDHVAWLKVALTAREIPLASLDVNLECLEEELVERLPDGAGRAAAEYLSQARVELAQAPAELPSLLEEDGPHVDLLRRYLLAALEARRDDAVALVTAAAASGVPIPELYRDVVLKAQAEIGRMWQMNEVHVGEEHMGSRIAERAAAALDAMAPRLPRSGRRALCTSTGGDLHDFGLRAVADHLEWAGWDAVLLGASTPSADLLLGIADFEVDLVVLSASLVLHLRTAAAQIAALRGRPEIGGIPVLIGGAPFARVADLWQVVGADACAPAIEDAVPAADVLVPRPGGSPD